MDIATGLVKDEAQDRDPDVARLPRLRAATRLNVARRAPGSGQGQYPGAPSAAQIFATPREPYTRALKAPAFDLEAVDADVEKS
jgi:hypothetical protein